MYIFHLRVGLYASVVLCLLLNEVIKGLSYDNLLMFVGLFLYKEIKLVFYQFLSF